MGCSCSCWTAQYNAAANVDSCYPIDDRSEPVLAHLRELIAWGKHDTSRLETVHEILSTKVHQDRIRGNNSRVSVGMKIMANLLNEIPDVRYNISAAMTECIKSLIETKQRQYIEIACCSTLDMMNSINRQGQESFLQQIILEYIELGKDDLMRELAFESITCILSKELPKTNPLSMTGIPIEELLDSIYPDYFEEDSARKVIKYMVRLVKPVTLSLFSNRVFDFLTRKKYWSDIDSVCSLMVILLSEVEAIHAPGLFNSLFDQDPQQITDAVHANEIISIADKLTQQLKADRILSNDSSKVITSLYKFTLLFLQCNCDNMEPILQKTYAIEAFIVSNIPNSRSLDIANGCLWDFLPDGKQQQNEYDVHQVIMLFKFSKVLDQSVKFTTSKAALTGKLSKIENFLLKFQNGEEIIKNILDYLSSLFQKYSEQYLDSLLNFLLDVQKEAKKFKNGSILHTFVMCSMENLSHYCPEKLASYIQEVCRKRIETIPIQVDLSLSFTREQFHILENMVQESSPMITIYFSKKAIRNLGHVSKQSSLPSIDIGNGTNEEEYKEEEDNINVENTNAISIGNQDNNEVSELSTTEPPLVTFEEAVERQDRSIKEQNSFIFSIDAMSYEPKSVLSYTTTK